MHIAKNVKWLVKNFLDMMLLERNIAKFEKHREEFVANGYIVHQPWKVLDNFSHFPPRKLLKFICPKKGRSALYN